MLSERSEEPIFLGSLHFTHICSVMPPPIPPSIEEYITNKQRDSLSLITSTSGASANWLVIRQLWAALRVRHRRTPNDALSLPTDSSAVASDDPHTVILVSWMRDLEFWKLESKRALVRSVKHQKMLCELIEKSTFFHTIYHDDH